MGYIGEGINQTRTSVETAKDEFFGTYYGQISSDPSVDPNGNAITDGDLFYNTSEEALKIRVNGEWLSLRTATTGYQQFTAGGGQTTFDVAGSFSPGFVFVTLNGVVLSSGDYDDSSGTEIVLTDGAASGDILGLYLFDTFSVADTVSASAGGTFSGPVDFSDGLNVDSNNLLVGTNDATPGFANTNAGISVRSDGGLFVSRTDQNVAYFNRSGSDGSIVEFRKDGSIIGKVNCVGIGDHLTIGNNRSGLFFASGEDLILPYDGNNTPDGVIDLGDPNDRFKDLYLSGGIYLGGTGSANYLDDYEEGTWTPVFRFVNATYVQQEGYYKKIGSIVNCYGFIEVSSLDTADGSTFGFSALPFAPSPDQAGYSANGSLSNVYGETNIIQSVPSGQVDARVSGDSILFDDITTTGATATFRYSAGYFRTSGVVTFYFSYTTDS